MKTINSNHKVAIFCGSMFGSKKEYKDLAIKVIEYLSKNDYGIVYGGGENGLMGIVANTALNNKAHVTGIIPDFLDNRETIHRKIDKIIITKTMEQRKKKFLSISNSFIACGVERACAPSGIFVSSCITHPVASRPWQSERG